MSQQHMTKHSSVFFVFFVALVLFGRGGWFVFVVWWQHLGELGVGGSGLFCRCARLRQYSRCTSAMSVKAPQMSFDASLKSWFSMGGKPREAHANPPCFHPRSMSPCKSIPSLCHSLTLGLGQRARIPELALVSLPEYHLLSGLQGCRVPSCVSLRQA